MSDLKVGRKDLEPVLRPHRGNGGAAGARWPAPGSRRRCSRSWAATSSSTPRSEPGSPTWPERSRPARASSATARSRCCWLADRAAEVASDFFYAAIDEFDDRSTPWRDTHRTLAQATLKGVGA